MTEVLGITVKHQGKTIQLNCPEMNGVWVQLCDISLTYRNLQNHLHSVDIRAGKRYAKVLEPWPDVMKKILTLTAVTPE
jgi:hypothetical protein